jgi:predicted membrane protein
MKTMSHLAALVLLFSSLFYFFSYPEVDPDLWGHLYFGREIVQNAKLPLENLYSYTAPDYRWINHEWLAEIVFYGLFHFFGSPGLILFKVALGGGLIWILDLNIKKRVVSPFVRTLTLVLTMAILSPGFNVRPQIFTYLLFAAFLYLFYRYEEKDQAALYWTPLLTAFWVNLHGGFVAGLGALGLFSLLSIFLGGRQGLTTGRSITWLIIPLALSLLVLGLNPYGGDLLWFLWRDLLLTRPITEWGPVPLWDFSFLEFKLAFLFFLLISMRRDSLRRWDFILTVLAAFFAFRHQRHTPLFAIVAAPLLAEGMQRVSHWIGRGARDGIVAAGLFVVALYLVFSIGRIHLQHRFQLIVSPREYPTQAVDFLQRNGIRGNLAVPFDWGEYLIWKLYPGVRVSIDGRYTTAYPMEVIQDNFEWMGGGREWRRLLEHYPTEIAITKRYHPVTEHLRKDPAWAYIYSDPIAFIFVRETASQQKLLAKFREKRFIPPQASTIYFPG